MDDRISRDVFLYNTVKERLKAMYELEDDEQTLLDTLEGETSLNERLGRIAESALDDEADAAACKARIETYEARGERLCRRAQHKRNIIKWAMEETGQGSLKLPAITLSTRVGKPRLIIDNDKLPDAFKKVMTSYSSDKAKIQEAIDRGEVPEGVQIANAETILSLRAK